MDLADATRNGTVVYFYPKAFTPGCTTEACDFRDNLAALKGQGYDVYGVSGDDPQELQRFVTEYHLPYTLLSDPDHAAAKEWGAWGGDARSTARPPRVRCDPRSRSTRPGT